MPKSARERTILRHRDGSVWAKGWKRAGKLDGLWTWFRKDGTRLRSGRFERGKRVGDWTTYDARGRVYKVTRMRE
jgi:antitoxin component YwqK of YwqJK toxin-antitoxin module